MTTRKALKREITLPSQEYDEITIAVLGNVDSGKSTTVGVLTNPEFCYGSQMPESCLDDGNGKSRQRILHHYHELASGRTSSITYNYMTMDPSDNENKEARSRMVNFVDLAGHEKYLKTTINGVVSSFPDSAIVCVGTKITNITKEHIKILMNMSIPFLVIFTKIDIIPAHIVKKNIQDLKKLLRPSGSKFFQIQKTENIDAFMGSSIVPFIKISNKTGEGLDLLCDFINKVEKKDIQIKDMFLVDHVYNVPGFGTVVSGICGFPIEKNNELLLGPFQKNEFIKVKVRTIHNDYRKFVDNLEPNVRGCLCIKVDQKYKPFLRSGLILVPKTKNFPKTSKNFLAELMIFHHSTTIQKNYTAHTNCHSIKESVKFNKLYSPKNPEEEIKIVRSGEKAVAELEFLKNYNYVEEGSRFLFREGKTMGIGKIISAC